MRSVGDLGVEAGEEEPSQLGPPDGGVPVAEEVVVLGSPSGVEELGAPVRGRQRRADDVAGERGEVRPDADLVDLEEAVTP